MPSLPRVLLCLALSALCSLSAAQYPDRTIRLIVPYPPGGSFDGPARIVAHSLGKAAGQTVVVENRGGAGGAIGAAEVQRASADGYTILLSSGALAVATAFSKQPPFDAIRDFDHVARFATLPSVLAVNAQSVSASSLAEFVTMSRAAPGKFMYASAGTGSAGHLATELLKDALGVDWIHVPYKGTGPALQDLIGGRVNVSLIGLSAALPHHKAGALKMLGVTTRARAEQMPEVPSISEVEAKYEYELWLGFAAPKGTPPGVLRRLEGWVAQVLKDPELQAQLRAAGVNPEFEGSADTQRKLENEVKRYLATSPHLKAAMNP